MVDHCSYIGKFECAVCQGVEAHVDYCVLNCGHPFHVLCVETWLERSATCPSCRAKVSRRQIRPLTGVASAVDAEGDECFQQQLAEKHQRLLELQQHLDEKQERIERLTSTMCELSNSQDRLQTKLADAKRRRATLEAAQLEDQQRVCNLTTEKNKLLEKYKTDVALLQHQFKEEQHLRQRQATELRRLQLSNPRLNMSAIHAIASDISEKQSAVALASALAERNTQLQECKARVEQLLEQLKQQHEAEAKQMEVTRLQHEAEKAKVEQDKQQYMKDALQLEYENSKLRQENKALSQQMQQLQGVLLVMERDSTSAAAQQLIQRQWQPLQENIPPWQGQQQQQQQQQQQPAQPQQQQLQQNKQQQQQPSSSKQSASFSTAVIEAAAAAVGGPRSEIVNLADGDACVAPTQQAYSHSPASKWLEELLDELTGPEEGKQSQQEACLQGALDVCNNQQSQQDTESQPQQRLASVNKAHKQRLKPQQVDMSVPFGPGNKLPGSLLRPGPALQAPSFMAKGKAAHGGGVSGDFVRTGPDGRGGTITHLKQGLKRRNQSIGLVGTAGSSKKSHTGSGCSTATGFVTKSNSKTGQIGITSYFSKR